MTASSNDSELLGLLKNLEHRISQIESRLGILVSKDADVLPAEKVQAVKNTAFSNEEGDEILEFQIGQFWLAKIGIIAFVAGIVFLLVVPIEGFSGLLPPIIGLAVSAVLITLSWYLKENRSYISGYLLTSGIVALFVSVLRLHFFDSTKLIESSFVVVLLLLIISAVTLIISIRNISFSLAVLGLILGAVAAMISNSAIIIFSLLVILSLVSIYLKIRFNWQGILITGMVVTCLTHLLWFLNNPFIGNELSITTGYDYNLIFILIYLFIFSIGNLIYPKDIKEDFFISFITFMNCLLFSGTFISIMASSGSDAVFYLPASIMLVSISILHWVKQRSKFSTFFYSIFGYMFLSLAIIASVSSPDLYIVLGWQSLIVISTAVWFRSKIIVLANFTIFIFTLIAFLFSQSEFSLISISFGIIALLSARILNWQKKRLELTTEQMRNAYLLVALLIIPYSLYVAMPGIYVAFAWIGVALIYYLLSIVLKIKKYRWMALLTLLLTVGYIFILGFTTGNNTYKILSFLTVGAVLIVTSILYSKKKQNIKSV